MRTMVTLTLAWAVASTLQAAGAHALVRLTVTQQLDQVVHVLSSLPR